MIFHPCLSIKCSTWPLYPNLHVHVFISKASSDEAVLKPCVVLTVNFCGSSCDSTETANCMHGKRIGQLPAFGSCCSDCHRLTLSTMAGHLAQVQTSARVGRANHLFQAHKIWRLPFLPSTASCRLDEAQETTEPGCTIFTDSWNSLNLCVWNELRTGNCHFNFVIFILFA